MTEILTPEQQEKLDMAYATNDDQSLEAHAYHFALGDALDAYEALRADNARLLAERDELRTVVTSVQDTMDRDCRYTELTRLGRSVRCMYDDYVEAKVGRQNAEARARQAEQARYDERYDTAHAINHVYTRAQATEAQLTTLTTQHAQLRAALEEAVLDAIDRASTEHSDNQGPMDYAFALALEAVLAALAAPASPPEPRKCWHGHTTRQVGCVSCVIVFDHPTPSQTARAEP